MVPIISIPDREPLVSSTMELRGIISDGRIVIEGGVGLPDGTRVSVRVSPARSTRLLPKKPSRRGPDAKLANSLIALASLGVPTGLTDLADRHDELVDGESSSSKPARKRVAGKRRS